jgi:hypothetical protein
MRKAYVQIFSEQDVDHKETPLWWKDQLLGIATSLKQDMIRLFSTPDSREEEAPSLFPTLCQSLDAKELDTLSPTFELAINGHLQTFSWTETPVVTIGRMPGCDMRFTEEDVQKKLTMSRLHCLVFPVPEARRFIVVDVGSQMGYHTTHRSVALDQKYHLTSQAFGRQSLFTEKDEIVVLTLANSTLVINPKMCLICLEQSRHTIFKTCRHYVCCEDCAAKVNSCPLCRDPHVDVHVGDAAHSNAV